MILTIEAETAAELRSKLVDVVSSFGANLPDDSQNITPNDVKSPIKIASESTEAGTPVKNTSRTKKSIPNGEQVVEPKAPQKESKRSKKVSSQKKKAEDPEKKAEAPEKKAEAPEKKVEAPGRDDILKILQVVAKNNLNQAKEILKEFGYSRVSEVEPAKYAEFYDACQQAAAV